MKTQNEANANRNTLGYYSSKVKRIYIPVPGFKFFHRPSEENDMDSSFIGRDRIAERLSNWLRDKDGNKTGAYLITGYRGMGKTSFVGKVINDLIKEQDWRANSSTIFWRQYTCLCVILALLSILATFPLNGAYIYLVPIIIVVILLISLFWRKKLYTYILDLCTILPVLFGMLYVWRNDNCWGIWIILTYLVMSFLAFLFLHKIIGKTGSEKYILKIKINIGNEIMDARDVLSVLAYSIKERISLYAKTHLHTLYKNVALRSIQWSVVALVGITVYKYAFDILDPVSIRFYSQNHDSLLVYFLKAVNEILYTFRTPKFIYLGSLLGILFSFTIGFFVSKMVRRAADAIAGYIGRDLPKPSRIIDKLTVLCEHITAAINEEKGGPVGGANLSFVNISLMKRKVKHQQPASVREIEQALVAIIKEINTSDSLQCRMIIIFDELDKLHNPEDSEKSEKLEKSEKDNTDLYPEFTFNENGISKDTSLNQKKHRILSLLGQLKYFISSAEAKFIFIAGHELYDAYLADVSDREYSVNSIFSGVINVDSFFSCDSGIKDITKLTEAYLCKQLMPDANKTEQKRYQFNYDIDTFNLKTYSDKINKGSDIWQAREVESVIAFLRQFVTYLTFVSNGAPKKLTSNFEKYIISKEMYDQQFKRSEYIKEDTTIRLTGKSEEDYDYYLAFGYYDQQKIGFIHYMACPVFENIISPASESGDKLLIASSFLIAHIYKHHNSGFSWRNMEYMPELLNSSNRTPELRAFINSIISYLGQIHLTSLSSGIYSYKFPLRLAEEITLFSKKSEELSAIFNFSLDYSLAVKKFYYRLFNFYKTGQNVSDAIIGSLHHNLGDIHLANDEYTEAIAQYRLTAQAIDAYLNNLKCFIETQDELSGNISAQIIRYTRVMLKLGLAYEKRNTFDSAFLIYSTLTSRLMSFREFDEEKLGLEYLVVKKDVANKEDFNDGVLHPSGKRIILTKAGDINKLDEFGKICYPPTESDTDVSKNMKYWIYGEELTDNLSDMMTPKKYALISKLSVFEDLRLAYLPILAKLFALEKHNICGITKDNVKVAEAEYQYLFLITNSEEKYMLSVDFFRKLGDILYYKNGSLYQKKRDGLIALISFWGYDLKNAIFDYCYNNGIAKKETEQIIGLFNESCNYDAVKDKDSLLRIIKKKQKHTTYNKHIEQIINGIPKRIISRIDTVAECGKLRKGNSMLPCAACRYYNRSLYIMFEHLISCSKCKELNSTKSWAFLCAFKEGNLYSYRYNELTQAALTLISMGNVLLSCSTNNDTINSDFIKLLFQSDTEWEGFKYYFSNYGCQSHLEKSILYYWTAMKYHEKAGNLKDSGQCLIWIFNILSYYICFDKEFIINDFSAISNNIMSSTIINIHRTRELKNISETRTLRDILSSADNPKHINLGLTSIFPDIEELLLGYYEILLELSARDTDKSKYWEEIELLYNSPSLTSLRNESLSYNRVISLLFKAKLNERLLNDLYTIDHWNKLTDEQFDHFNPIFRELEANFQQILKIFKLSEGTLQSAELLSFLISDSIFCLLKATDYLQSTMRTTLFTNSFCYEIYKQLSVWVMLKDKYLSADFEPSSKERLENEMEALVEKHSVKLLRVTYLQEMSNMYLDMAKSMHTEGNEYKEFIKAMYILDDDLQNNTCQFYFALERFKLNRNGFETYKSNSITNEYFAPEAYFKWRDIKQS